MPTQQQDIATSGLVLRIMHVWARQGHCIADARDWQGLGQVAPAAQRSEKLNTN